MAKGMTRPTCCPPPDGLPPSPPGKTSWPWTEDSPQLPDTMPNGKPWPKTSLVTPSYNQGQFKRKPSAPSCSRATPTLEYFVIDGGTKDGSVDIIRKHEDRLAYWDSEPYAGQYDAIT